MAQDDLKTNKTKQKTYFYEHLERRRAQETSLPPSEEIITPVKL